MPKIEGDPLGPGFERRLRGELDRIQPSFPAPRYLSPTRRPALAWRPAPVALGLALIGIAAISAYAATGSPNPAVWTERVVTISHSSPTPPATSAGPEVRKAAPPAPPARTPGHEASPAASNRPEPSESPEPIRSPEPGESSGTSGEHSDTGDSSSSSQPSPAPADS